MDKGSKIGKGGNKNLRGRDKKKGGGGVENGRRRDHKFGEEIKFGSWGIKNWRGDIKKIEEEELNKLEEDESKIWEVEIKELEEKR